MCRSLLGRVAAQRLDLQVEQRSRGAGEALKRRGMIRHMDPLLLGVGRLTRMCISCRRARAKMMSVSFHSVSATGEAAIASISEVIMKSRV